MKKYKLLVLFFILLSTTYLSFSADFVSLDDAEKFPVVVDGKDVTYDSVTKSIKAEGDVKISYQGVSLFCDKVSVSTTTSVAEAEGDVKIVHEQGVIYGDKVTYDFKNKKASIFNLNMTSAPFYAYGESANKVSETEYDLNNAYVTTCDLKNPRYRFVAKKIIMYPDNKIVAKNVFLKIGDIPVFYIPYYMQPVKDKLPRVTLVPGNDKEMGFYLLSAWRYYFSEYFKGRLHLDYYANKGFGWGVTHNYDTKNFGKGNLKLYYISDDDGKSFDDIVNTGVDRYKIQLKHLWEIDPTTLLRVELNKFSDNSFMKDYFRREYERDTHPLSYVLLTKSLRYSSFSILAQKRLNRFYAETEYLPELKWEVYSRPIGESDFYIDSISTISNLAYSDASPTTVERDVFRMDNHTSISYQKRLGFISMKPYVGVRNTYYSQDAFDNRDVDRTIFDSGIEMSTKFYRLYDDVNVDFLGIKANSLKHIITPIVRYSYVHRPTVSKDHLLQFDSIDALDRENKITFILENKLKAKNEEWNWDMIYFAPSVSYVFNDENRGSHYAELSSDFEFRPFKEVFLQNETKYDFNQRAITEMNTDLVWEKTTVKLVLGHRYAREESSQITTSFDYQINPKWSFYSYQRFEAKTGEWKEQQYYIRRDLHSWFMDIGVDFDEDKEVTFWVVFRIKAFPDIGIDFKKSYNGPKDR